MQRGTCRVETDDRGSHVERTQLAIESWDPAYGARPLKRTIQERVENARAERVLRGEFGEGDRVMVGWDGGQFVFTRG